jgi:hypothetical protein
VNLNKVAKLIIMKLPNNLNLKPYENLAASNTFKNLAKFQFLKIIVLVIDFSMDKDTFRARLKTIKPNKFSVDYFDKESAKWILIAEETPTAPQIRKRP